MKHLSHSGRIAFASLLCAGLVQATSAAPPGKPSAARTLSFGVTARFSAPSSGEEEQVLSAKVQTKDRKVRVETMLSDRPTVFLLSPPYVYKLIPEAKSGVRWKNAASAGGFDIQALLSDPSKIRALLKSRGAKFIGSGKLNAVAVDIFTARDLMGQKGVAKAWLRHSDALPLRLEVKSGALQGAVSWRDYRRGAPLPDSLFKVPANYDVRESPGRANGM